MFKMDGFKRVEGVGCGRVGSDGATVDAVFVPVPLLFIHFPRDLAPRILRADKNYLKL